MEGLRNVTAGSGIAEVNRAVIVSVSKFDHGVDMDRRPGTKADTKRLHCILSKLGFKVTIEEDLSAVEIYQVFREASQAPVRDCFLAVLSSHGEEGCVFGADGEPVRLARVFSFFDSPCMTNKTKLFFVQACRGGELDEGVQVDSAMSDDTEENAFSQSLSVPVDTAVIYATPPGYAAITGFGGAVFLQTLCCLLEEEGGRELEITRLLTRLCHRVAYTFQARGRALGGKKEMPCFLTRLTREVFPFARNSDALTHSMR